MTEIPRAVLGSEQAYRSIDIIAGEVLLMSFPFVVNYRRGLCHQCHSLRRRCYRFTAALLASPETMLHLRRSERGMELFAFGWVAQISSAIESSTGSRDTVATFIGT